jgi:cysteinyl-tRNA synthetase
MLRVHNSLTRQKQDFVPIQPGRVGMYVCGMTVYDHAHIGHARVMVVFDVIRRWLQASGFSVRYVRNITDIDDKIIKRAAEETIPSEELASRYIGTLRADVAALGCMQPDIEPRATDHIPEMLELIAAMEKRGIAYAVDGDVYCAVGKGEVGGVHGSCSCCLRVAQVCSRRSWAHCLA